MKIAVCSDLHLEFLRGGENPLPEHLKAMMEGSREADVVVLAGDTHTHTKGPKWAAEAFPHKTVIMVAGNHEFYRSTIEKEIGNLKAAAAAYPNIHFLENEEVEIQGVVFLGCCLWSDFRLYGSAQALLCQIMAQEKMADYNAIRSVRRGYKPIRTEDTYALHRQSVKWLRERLEVHKRRTVVVVTHHAPSDRSTPAQYQGGILNAAFASNLDWMIEEFQPALWLHGHTHGHADYLIGKTRVICNCAGYPGSGEPSGFDPHFVVEV